MIVIISHYDATYCAYEDGSAAFLSSRRCVHTMQVPTSYAEAFVGVVSQFQKHFAERGWNHTKLQFYLNDNPSKARRHPGLWLLDEPVDFLDYVGLGYVFTPYM